MKSFRTEIEIKPSENKISHKDKLMFIGSCFTESIGEKLTNLLFYPDINPFGILYNPASATSCLSFLANSKKFRKTDIFHHNEMYHSFYHHSRFSDPVPDNCLRKINSQAEYSSAFIKSCSCLFITFGTAWIYELNGTGEAVSNCHKLPDKMFSRRLMEVDEIVSVYIELIKQLEELNPGLRIVFTVSPVRHWKDGAENNMLSKSVLHVAIHKLTEEFSNVSYFPSYEIMMDDLRDYRFYKDDMLHPDSVAVDYIFERFCDVFFDKETRALNDEINKLNDLAMHRPFNSGSHSHTHFKQNCMEKISKLQKKHPEINFSRISEKFSDNN